MALSVFLSFVLTSASSLHAQNTLAVRALTSMGSDLYAGIDAYTTDPNLPWVDAVYRSTDHGASWSGIGLAHSSVYALASIRGTLIAGSYYTKDSGKTWTHSTISPSSLCVKDSIVFAGTTNGVFRSTDEGVSWQKAFVDTSILATGIYSMACNGTDVFAGTDDQHGATGIYRSTDDGATWTNIGPPNAGILAIATIGSKLAVSAFWEPGSGILISSDTGRTWVPKLAGDCMSIVQAGSYLFAGIANAGVPTNRGVFASTDTGQTWTNVALFDTSVTALAVSGNYLVAGMGGAAFYRFAISELIGARAVSDKPAQQNKFSTYPNPFSQSTTISFTPEASGYADVSVVNLLGVEVARIFSGELAAGEHRFTWDATTGDGCATGMYECLVRMNGRVEKLPLMIVR